MAAALAGATGCATVPYRYGRDIEKADTLRLKPGEPQFERGRPNAFIDGVGWVLGIPSKIILLNKKMDNHAISPHTEEALLRYLATNDLRNVKVRINQYAPIREWRRLVRNKSVAWGWRYTLGAITWAFETILPGRLFGGDRYNPYSNTISLFSDHKAVAIHEGGHAKDFAQRTYKGTYAFAYVLPFAALYHEAQATGDAVGYLREERPAGEEKGAYKVLYPAYGTYIGGSFSRYVLPEWWIYAAAVVPGHVAGRWKATTVDERREEEERADAVVP